MSGTAALLLPLLFGLFLLVAAWRVWRSDPRRGLIGVVVVAAFAVLMGHRLIQQLGVRRDLAELTHENVTRVELDGHPIGRPEDAGAVVEGLREADWWFFTYHRRLSRAVPLIVTLSNGGVRRYEVARALDGSGAVIRFSGHPGSALSLALPQALSAAGAPLP
jgi:hypothetical protein